MTDQILPHIPVIIIGAGQAGLSVRWYLKRDGIEHIVLERHRNFHAWRAHRWDSFCLVTPNWQCRLPDWPYQGPDPDGFMLRDQIVDYLDGFTASFDPPLRKGTSVTRVTPVPEGYRVETTSGTWTTGQVVVATGGYDRPIIPPYAGAIAPQITQMHSVDYRRAGHADHLSARSGKEPRRRRPQLLRHPGPDRRVARGAGHRRPGRATL